MIFIGDEIMNRITDFESKIEQKEFLNTKENLSVMQVNVGKLCNIACTHCHVEAGPNRAEIMDKETIDSCLRVFKKHGFKTMDITGGAPEMNPNFRYFLEEVVKVAEKVIVRTNLVILTEEGYRDLPKLFADNGVEVVASLPCYTEDNTDKMRGKGVFDKSIEALKVLNELGYGKEENLVLDLVYNPGGPFLPPCQEALTVDYRKRLSEDYGIVFTNLFTITNNPIGRFKKGLEADGKLEEYMKLLEDNFNPGTVENMMCRDQVSISWDGYIYDCDFNQMIDLKADMEKVNIKDLDRLDIRKIKTGNHCYACTAGAGSSCGGATA